MFCVYANKQRIMAKVNVHFAEKLHYLNVSSSADDICNLEGTTVYELVIYG